MFSPIKSILGINVLNFHPYPHSPTVSSLSLSLPIFLRFSRLCVWCFGSSEIITLNMAARATAQWRNIISRYQNVRLISTSTQSKMQPHASPHGGVAAAGSFRTFRTDYIPIYTLFGMMLLAVSLGTWNVKHELVHCPSVLVDKKKRKTVPEVDNSELVMKKTEDFVNKSIFRKLGQGESQIIKPMP